MFRVKSSAMTQGYDSIKIPCRNGLEFTEGQQIVFDLGREIGIANLKNAVIEMDININGNAACPLLQLNRVNGGQSIINRISIRSNGRLLEQLDNYNLYAGLHYSATHDNGVGNKRNVNEGCASSYRIQDNPFVTQNEAALQGASLDAVSKCWKYIDRKIQIPILGGIFQNPQNMPLMAIPLEVEIILEKNVRCLYSEALLVDNLACENLGAAPIATIVLSAAECLKYGVVGTGNEFPSDSKLNMKANFPFRKDQIVLVSATGGVGAVTNGGIFTISEINDDAAGKLTVVMSAVVNTNTLTGVTLSATNAGALLAGASVSYQVKQPRLIVPKVIPAPQFTQAMSAAIAKGSYSMNIVSWTDYQTSVNGSTTKSTNIIPADLSRVKSILSVPQELADIDKYNNMRAQHGSYMDADSYEYQINNRMVPSRLVSLAREAHGSWTSGAHNYQMVPSWANGSILGAVHSFEVEKALGDANIEVRNLKFLSKTAVNAFSDGYYLIGRTLGSYGMSENLMGVSAILYLNYLGTNNNLKLLHNYCVHLRTISVGPQGVALNY